MRQDYYIFDIEAFVKDQPERKERLKRLKSELADLDWPYQSTTDPGKSSDPSDTTGMIVARRADKQAEIDEVQADVDVYDKMFNSLTKEQKFIINTLFNPHGYMSRKVLLVGEKLHVSEVEVYRRRRVALEQMRSML